MKYPVLVLVLLVVVCSATAQLKVKAECGTLIVDVYKGWINEAKPNIDPEQIKIKLPCFSSFEKEGSGSTCGGGVYYDDKGLRFYTQRDYMVITDKFRGKFTAAVLGVRRGGLFKNFGNPKLKDVNWEAYQMAYGIMIVYYNTGGVVNKVIISTKTTDNIDLCSTN